MNDMNGALEAKKDLDLRLDDLHRVLDPTVPVILATPACWGCGCREGCRGCGCREGCRGCGCREGCRGCGCREGCRGCH
jgi:hypothetical protein